MPPVSQRLWDHLARKCSYTCFKYPLRERHKSSSRRRGGGVGALSVQAVTPIFANEDTISATIITQDLSGKFKDKDAYSLGIVSERS